MLVLAPGTRLLAYWVANTQGVYVGLVWQALDGFWYGCRFGDGVTVFAASSTVCQRRLFIVPPRVVAPGWVWVARYWWVKRRFGGFALNVVEGQAGQLKLGRGAYARFVVNARKALAVVVY